MSKMIGFIGGGNMASAMISGILNANIIKPEEVMVSCKSQKSVERLREDFGIQATQDNSSVAKAADILFLAVKPNLFSVVIPEIRDCLKEGQVVISIAAGQSLSSIHHLFGSERKLVRAMPNTPALVGESMSALSFNALVSEEERQEVKKIFESFGQVEIVPETLMDAVVGVSGSSPAYVYLFIEAMADAAVADGMTRKQAYKFAAQSVLGAAKMVLDTGKHPGSLKDAVCSPGGTTIEAVAKLEETGFRQSVIAAQRACVEKSKEMSKEKE